MRHGLDAQWGVVDLRGGKYTLSKAYSHRRGPERGVVDLKWGLVVVGKGVKR